MATGNITRQVLAVLIILGEFMEGDSLGVLLLKGLVAMLLIPILIILLPLAYLYSEVLER